MSITNHLLHRHDASVLLGQQVLVDLDLLQGAVELHSLADLVRDERHSEVQRELDGGVHVYAVDLLVTHRKCALRTEH